MTRLTVSVLTAYLCTCVQADLNVKSTGIARFDTILTRAVDFLTEKPVGAQREQTLVAYALFKAGAGADHPIVSAALRTAARRAESRAYRQLGYDHIYLAGVDAMLLADAGEQSGPAVQLIADYVSAAQRPDGSWSDAPDQHGDSSMSQYGMLALWAASRCGCQLNPAVIDRAASFYLRNRNPDGGWGYRPGTDEGPGKGRSVHNMVLAGAGSLAIARLLLHGPNQPTPESLMRGPLRQVVRHTQDARPFPGYVPRNSRAELSAAINRAMMWIATDRQPVSRAAHRIYFYYSLERASALSLANDQWYPFYGDGLATLQGSDGAFQTHSSPHVGTSFAILYYVRATRSAVEPLLGDGTLIARKDLTSLYGSQQPKAIPPLDSFLNDLEAAADGIEKKIQETDAQKLAVVLQHATAEELISQQDRIRQYLSSSSPVLRANACYALSRTGNLSHVPLLLDALRDHSPWVNAKALEGLRFLARKPHGLGLPAAPDLSDSGPQLRGTHWQNEATRRWMNWYRAVRPYEETDGLDELAAL